MRHLIRTLVGQERARANARSAATALSQDRVTREEVTLFLDEVAARRAARSA